MVEQLHTPDDLIHFLPEHGDLLDYFDFPISAFAFGLSNHSYPGAYGGCLWRVQKSSVTLISYPSVTQLKGAVVDLSKEYRTFKGLNYVFKDDEGLPTSKSPPEFYVERGWAPPDTKSIRYEIRKGDRTYEATILGPDDATDVDELMKSWIAWAGGRHFMVFKGHYLRYVEQWKSMADGPILVGFRRRSDRVLFGMLGFEVFRDQAQITLAKHLGGDYTFATTMWSTGLRMILEAGVRLIHCGSTADKLKTRLGMSCWPSFKIDMKRIVAGL